MISLESDFFDRDASCVASDLLGVELHHEYKGIWLAARIIETESYYINEKGSHASLGRTSSREPLFMKPGTIYMYYARGGDSLNFSCRGEGNAVLIKSAVVTSTGNAYTLMSSMNPQADGSARLRNRLCSGQTLLCKAMGIKVPDYWGTCIDDLQNLRLALDESLKDYERIQTLRLGIPEGRDEHLWQRFILKKYSESATKNPLSSRKMEYALYHTAEEILWEKTAGKLSLPG